MIKLLLGLFLFPISLFAQSFPVEAGSGKIVYSEEVLVKDADHVDLFKRARKWIVSSTNNGAPLKTEDTVNGVLVADGWIKLTNTNTNKGQHKNCKLSYTIKIKVDDDRYWYRFSDFYLEEKQHKSKKGQITKYPLETIILTATSSNKTISDQTEKKLAHKKLQENIRLLIEQFKASML